MINATSNEVKELYNKYVNKQFFIIAFGTTKFNKVDQKFLNKMYKFLVNKVNELFNRHNKHR
jgi:glutathione peroxidase-family protein